MFNEKQNVVLNEKHKSMIFQKVNHYLVKQYKTKNQSALVVVKSRQESSWFEPSIAFFCWTSEAEKESFGPVLWSQQG